MKTKEIRRRQGFYFRLLAVTGVILLLFLTVISLLWPSRRFSASERRNLSQRPTLSYEGLLDGSFSDDVESYLADQYPARDIWVYLNSLQNRLLGIDFQNGIYRGKDGYLIQRFDTTKIDAEKQTALASFLERHSDISSYLMLVPTASWILADHLPTGAPQESEKDWYEKWLETSGLQNQDNVTIVETAEELSAAAKEQQIYYRTDHHWTTYGASVGFEKLAEKMSLPYEKDDFEPVTVHTKFQGTMMSSSGFYSGTKDSIDLYLPKEPETLLVTNKEAQTTVTTIYSEEGLLGNDPYEVFLGGNYGLLNIKTSSTSGRKLLLLKDSYANAMIGFLTPYFSEIDLVDPRYYSSDLEMQIAVGQYTDILILYNLQSFASDTSLSLVLGKETAE